MTDSVQLVTSNGQDNSALPRPTAPPVVLVLDDDPKMRAWVGAILRVGGMEVIEAETGEEALEILSIRHEELRLVIADIWLPGNVSGIDVTRCCSRWHSQIPVVALTADNREETKRHALDAGAVYVCRKDESTGHELLWRVVYAMNSPVVMRTVNCTLATLERLESGVNVQQSELTDMKRAVLRLFVALSPSLSVLARYSEIPQTKLLAVLEKAGVFEADDQTLRAQQLRAYAAELGREPSPHGRPRIPDMYLRTLSESARLPPLMAKPSMWSRVLRSLFRRSQMPP